MSLSLKLSPHNTIRNGKTDGGLAFVLHNSIQYNYEGEHNFTPFECASLKAENYRKINQAIASLQEARGSLPYHCGCIC